MSESQGDRERAEDSAPPEAPRADAPKEASEPDRQSPSPREALTSDQRPPRPHDANSAAPGGDNPDLSISPDAETDSSGEAPTMDPEGPSDQTPDASNAEASRGVAPTIDSVSASRSAASADATPQSTDAAAARDRIPGYEILGVLGRGGMGIVYRARQKGLKRIVALKMILAGSQASDDQLTRFRAEAEAVAQLQHPNIVQVYEVGEQAGLPYFSLEFIDGKPLNREIQGKPQTPKQAAELIETLARAIHHAHRHGIVHRDIKPANILLTTDGVPKITDFGIVKRLDADSSQTETGAIMGTINYMAPEQGRADKDVGSSVDVYSLGAMLYELLTGRPPFLGAAPLDTLMHLLNEEPVPPSRLHPKLPRDIETICLKCLQKEPRRRYASADELADELRRFQADEPILARPVGLVERLWRWRRRNPKLAIVGAVASLLALSIMIGGPTAAVIINRQKQKAVAAQHAAEQSEERAQLAQAAAEANEDRAIAAQKRADQNARAAAEQRQLALGALGTLVNEVQDQLKETPATYQLKQNLLKSALEGLRRVADSAGDSPVADQRMAAAHQRMGQIFIELGATEDAFHEYQQLHEILQKLAEDDPYTARSQRNIAVSYKMLGDTARLMGDLETARGHYLQAYSVRKALADANPTSTRAKIDVATSLISLGNVSGLEDKHEYYARALQLRTELLDEAPEGDRAERLRDVWIGHNMLAEVSVQQKDYAEARSQYEESLKLAEQLGQIAGDRPRTKLDLAHSYVNLGASKTRLGRSGAAKENFDQAVEILRPLASADPKNLEVQTSFTLALARAGRHEEAAEKAKQIVALAPDNFLHLYNIACCYSLCSAAAATAGDDEEHSAQSEALRKRYADAAIASLRDAVDNGLEDANYLDSDPDLAPIRDHPGYAALREQFNEP